MLLNFYIRHLSKTKVNLAYRFPDTAVFALDNMAWQFVSLTPSVTETGELRTIFLHFSFDNSYRLVEFP